MSRILEDDKENEAEGRRDAHGNPAGDRGTGVLDEVDEEIDDIHRSLCVVLRGCAGSVRVACFSIVRNECAVANQSQTTNGSMQCASQCDDGWQICTNRQYVPMGACLLVVFGRCARWLFNGCPAAVQRAQRLSGASGVRVGHAGESWPELVVLRRSSDGARVASHLILAIRWRETSHDFDFWRLFSSRATPNTP